MDNTEPSSSGNIQTETQAKKEEKKKMKKESVSLMGLFSSADKVDYFLMSLGGLGACIHGATLPLFFVFFGKMLDSLGNLSTDPKAISSRVSQVSQKQLFSLSLSLDFWSQVHKFLGYLHFPECSLLSLLSIGQFCISLDRYVSINID